jgi:hypothetical protein
MVIKRSKAGRNFLLCTNQECKHIANIPKKKAGAGDGEDEGNEAPEEQQAG